MRSWHLTLLIMILVGAVPVPCPAQLEIATLTASDGEHDDQFGHAVAVEGTVAVVSAIIDDDYTGAVYVFRNDGTSWIEEAKFTATDGEPADRFGNAVSVSGDVIVVGMAMDDDAGSFSGAVYVFRYNGVSWDEGTKLTAGDAASFVGFGEAVSVDGNVLAVGAPIADDRCSVPMLFCDSGAVYVFRYSGGGWVEEAKLTASDGVRSDRLGQSVAVRGNVLVAGAPFVDPDCDPVCWGAGAAYVFRHDGTSWNEEAKLLARDGALNDHFGISVATTGSKFVVGAWQVYTGNPGFAHVYGYDGTSWIDEGKLVASDSGDDDVFGTSVTIEDNRVVCGAPAHGTASGAAYVYSYDGVAWTEEAKLTASDAEAGDYLAASVSMSGGVVIAGAQNDDVGEFETGSARVFAIGRQFMRGDCNADGGMDIGDAVFFLGILFGDNLSTCDDACDGNDDGTLDIADAIFALTVFFGQGDPFPPPHPGCGMDPGTDGLGCLAFPACR